MVETKITLKLGNLVVTIGVTVAPGDQSNNTEGVVRGGGCHFTTSK